ncbi:hypothetical protein G6011_06099 [Alternaria panax]|uniref:Uncharacterized protein n=1 Tax=Alternaria panax TaxID=48097 RepID=A0AAD4FGI5_9PLEO|nr:hypothetical protein G6011_06099 [Alternaria panax]
MSTFIKHKSIPATFNDNDPAATAKSPRPTSAPYPNFSKHLAKETVPTAEPKLVAAEELQARIKAARRSRTATQPLPEAVRRKLDHSSDLIHPALRARSSVTPNPNRPISHRSKSREDLSIDAVIRRLSMEIDGQNSTRGHYLPDDIPPVPTLPAFPPAVSYRPRPRQTASRRSSMTMRRSPLSNVSSPDDSAETSSHTSRRTSASSRTSKSEESKDGDHDNDEVVRVISTQTSKARFAKRKHISEPQAVSQTPPSILRSTSPRAKSRSSWHTISRRSILCSV